MTGPSGDQYKSALGRLPRAGGQPMGHGKILPTERFEYEVMSNFDKPLQTPTGFQINGNCFNYYRLKRVDNGYGAVVEFDYESDNRDDDDNVGQYKVSGSVPLEYPKSGKQLGGK